MANYKNIDESKKNRVEDTGAVYLSNYIISNVSSKFKSQVETIFADKMALVKTIRNGINNVFFDNVKNTLPFSESEWSDLLNISTKSMQRYRSDATNIFKPIHTEKILEMAEVSALGLEVFDSQEQFYDWLRVPNFALGNLQPIELLKDSYGKDMVIDELHRIDNGIFA